MEPIVRERLSRISTQWTLLFEANAGPAAGVTTAQAAILERYRGAVYQYLLGAVRDADVAEELAQEFALRLVRGDFKKASPGKGRFRDYLRTALSHLITDYHRTRQAGPRQMPEGAPEAMAPQPADSEADFSTQWRAELLERTWEALEKVNPDYKAALLLRVAEPDLSSAEMALRLSEQIGRSITPEWVRKALSRSHEKFADLLLDEVAYSIGESAADEMEEELRVLDLLKYCQPALQRRRAKG